VLEADDYCQNYHWQFGDQLIFINYILMKKNEFKLLYTNYVKDMWSRKDLHPGLSMVGGVASLHGDKYHTHLICWATNETI
jgi:hypothetical protein